MGTPVCHLAVVPSAHTPLQTESNGEYPRLKEDEMHEGLVSPLQGLASHHNDDRQQVSLVGSLAGSKLVEAIEALDPARRAILAWQLGLEGSPADATTIAGWLAIPVAQVDRLIDEALDELGWELLSRRCSGTTAEAAA
jgi:hypothetical protein